jgi:hypothetical protein
MVQVDPTTGNHSGGPFKITISSRARVEDVRLKIKARA